jgi:hypothetical protein
MKEEIIKQNDEIKKRIAFMRQRIEISPAMEVVILKEAELAFKNGMNYAYSDLSI